jgi:hypothetical protein
LQYHLSSLCPILIHSTVLCVLTAPATPVPLPSASHCPPFVEWLLPPCGPSDPFSSHSLCLCHSWQCQPHPSAFPPVFPLLSGSQDQNLSLSVPRSPTQFLKLLCLLCSLLMQGREFSSLFSSALLGLGGLEVALC